MVLLNTDFFFFPAQVRISGTNQFKWPSDFWSLEQKKNFLGPQRSITQTFLGGLGADMQCTDNPGMLWFEATFI